MPNSNLTPLRPTPPDLEARVRELELWAVAAHAAIEAAEARAAALRPVVDSLQDAATAQAAIQARRDSRRARLGQYAGVCGTILAGATLTLKVLGR